ncbi:MAG: ribonuclease P protein component [Rhizobacter sp.]|nr:ribonuclease P protein component [Rhizobacter sp.]
MLGRIVRSEDFERVLAQPARARSPHFAVHFASGQPSRPGKKPDAVPGHSEAADNKLSTEAEPVCQQAVDDRVLADLASQRVPQAWLGAVVPKRHARRAVTRTLIKRQIRSAARRVDAAANGLEPGLWVVRLRAPFDRGAFPSAASGALRSAARVEIDALLSKCGART